MIFHFFGMSYIIIKNDLSHILILCMIEILFYFLYNKYFKAKIII
jgi:hypothetical protein